MKESSAEKQVKVKLSKWQKADTIYDILFGELPPLGFNHTRKEVLTPDIIQSILNDTTTHKQIST